LLKLLFSDKTSPTMYINERVVKGLC